MSPGTTLTSLITAKPPTTVRTSPKNPTPRQEYRYLDDYTFVMNGKALGHARKALDALLPATVGRLRKLSGPVITLAKSLRFDWRGFTRLQERFLILGAFRQAKKLARAFERNIRPFHIP